MDQVMNIQTGAIRRHPELRANKIVTFRLCGD